MCRVLFLYTHKRALLRALDPVTGFESVLFHPFQQRWSEHFMWDESKAQIIGLTPCGRATVEALQVNNQVIVRARKRWVAAGWHPPTFA
jgi:hypothetical protein